MYYYGQGIAQYYELAYLWLLLASANADAEIYEDAKEARDIVAKDLSTSQIERIQREAAQWKPKSNK